jgi:dynein heavy chain 2
MTQGAMLLGLGGNPIGGAGTGKTETVKALGAALGRHILIFNCDEGLDFSTMGRICAGLISSGAWLVLDFGNAVRLLEGSLILKLFSCGFFCSFFRGCFDEFNRCEQDQLSAIAQLIQAIQLAIKENCSEIQLLDKIIKVDSHTAIFITLNPAGKTFLGRSIMPQTLKALFRPIAMCTPNKQKIAEAFLYAEGFMDASNIADGTVNLFRLCSCFLSKQQHYDWGLRPLKSVLESAFSIMQRERREPLSKKNYEQSVVSRSILSSVLPGLVRSDRKLFLKIISDIFPGPLVADTFTSDISSSVEQVMKMPPYLMLSDCQFMEKVLQLNFNLNNRIGCLLLSPTFCGKTTLWKILKESLMAYGLHVVVHALNPKALRREKLLGSISPASRDWSDGLLTKLVRDAAAQPTSTRVWIVLDGEIDPEWVENLNSALDDNRVLTLPNGDRITLGRNINFIFETCDLTYASPATISRMGLIYLSMEDIKLDLIVARWVETQPEVHRADLKKWIEIYLIKLLPLSAQFSLSILGCPAAVLLNTLSQITEYSSETDFLQNMIRGVCSGMELEARGPFLTQAQQLTNHFLLDKNAEAYGKFKNTLTGLIATKNACRGLQILNAWLHSDFLHHLILIGPDGCGKETLLRSTLPNSSHCITIQCNKETEPDELIDVIRKQCRIYSSCRGQTYRPAGFDHLYLLVKDANVSKQDVYGTSILQEFLKQLLSHNGFFNDQMTFVLLQNVHVVLSLNPVLLRKQPLQPRLSSAARVLVLDDLSKIELIAICTEALKKKSAITESIPIELSSDEGRTKLARTIVELVLEANIKCNLSMTSHDMLSWANSMYRYGESAEFVSCINQETNRRIFSKISDHGLLHQYYEFFGTFMKKEWNSSYVGDYEAHCSVIFQSIECRGTSRGRDTMFPISPERFRKLLEKGIAEYKQVATSQLLVLTPSFLRNFSEIDQVLSENGSSLILRGKSGGGCQESLRLLCFLKNWSLVAPSIASERSLSLDFMYFLQEAIDLAAKSKMEKVCLLMEHHFIDDSTLSFIDNVLSTGCLSAILEKECARTLVSLKESMVEDGNFNDVRDFMMSQIKSKLRVCLCIDETSSDRILINLHDHYPHIFKHCSLLDVQDWCGQDLRAACLELFLEFPSPHQSSQVMTGDTKTNLKADNFAETVALIHESCDTLNATPRHLVKMIKMWDMLFSRQYKKIHDTMTSLQRGLQKLVEARQAVSELDALVEKQQEDVKRAQQQANDVMETISLALSEATLSRQKNNRLSVEMKEKTETAIARKACIQIELDSISPSLEEAKQSVQGITSENLSEIRALKAPPGQISVVLSAVLLMLGFKVSR